MAYFSEIPLYLQLAQICAEGCEGGLLDNFHSVGCIQLVAYSWLHSAGWVQSLRCIHPGAFGFVRLVF